MRVVYEAENIIDAYLVKGWLEQSGLPVYLRGEHLVGGIGELPVRGFLALCVPDSCEGEARSALDELEAERALAVVDEDIKPDENWNGLMA